MILASAAVISSNCLVVATGVDVVEGQSGVTTWQRTCQKSFVGR